MRSKIQGSMFLPYSGSMRIGFAITCKGRTQHLKQTLAKNIADNADYENCVFVLLDYNSQDDLKEYVQTFHQKDIDSGKLVVYSYPAAKIFEMGKAKNMAHRCAILEGASILVNLDADNFTMPGFATMVAEQYKIDPACFLWAHMIKDVLPRGINGRIACTRHQFLNAGGYDERFDSWASDDKDYNIRLRRLGYNGRQIHPRYLNAVRHTDKMRFKEYPHRLLESYYHPVDDYLMSSDVTIVNYGNIGCGTVFRNFSAEAIELKPIPTRIFGIGMHKTATTSLHLAMKLLNFDSAHWTNAHWAKAIWLEMNYLTCTCGHDYNAHIQGHHGDSACKTSISSGVQCDCENFTAKPRKSLTLEKSYHLCDLPIPMLFRELDKAYPGSKFILTTLADETWVKAAQIHWSPKNRFRSAWDSDPFSHQVHQALYGQRTFDREVFLARYRQHNQEVREYFKDRPEDLLEMPMSSGAGWKELAPFVGRPIPDVPYPHGNPNGE